VSLKDSCSAVELAARGYWQSLFHPHHLLPSVGQAGLEPARFFLIRGAPLPTWPLALVAREGFEPPNLPVMSGPLYHLSYLAMVGHRRVELRATCSSDRPLHRLGSGQRKRSESNAQGRGSPGFRPGAVASLLALPWAERARIELARPKLAGFRNRFRHQSDCLSMAEGTRIERVRANPATRFRRGTLPLGQPSTRGERPTRTARRSAHSLAARPDP
jgi:hypothetical protein